MYRLFVRRPRSLVVPCALAVFCAAGLVVAATLTQPLEVHLKSSIEILEQTEDGGWEPIDEVGPVNRRFEATLLELAQGREVASDFAFQTRTKRGLDYSARLAEPARIDYNPSTGQLVADLTYEVSLDGATATVPARLTTESRSGAGRSLRGKRARGTLGRGPTTLTVVSANELRLPGRRPILLLCKEEYKLIPKGAAEQGG